MSQQNINLPSSYSMYHPHVDQDGKNLKILHRAAREGNISACNQIFHHCVDVNGRDESGATPLCIAARYGHAEICNMLVMYGGFVHETDKYGHTPLHLAATHGHAGACGVLLDNCRAYIEALDALNNCTPLLLAAKNDHPDVCAVLLQRGANPFARDKCGYTPLYAAALMGHAGVCEAILSKGGSAVKSELNAIHPPEGLTLLHVAALRDHERVVEQLLDWGADVNAKDARGKTALSTVPLHLLTRSLLQHYGGRLE